MATSRQLLSILGQRNPAIYDIIFPRGPLSRLSQVALNPQPLPPHELGAAIAAEFIHTSWLTERFGQDLGLVFNDLENWCPTPPKWPKWPPGWPPIPLPEPEPHPEWLIDFHLGFAARLAVTSAEFEGTQLGESFNKAIERSVSIIESSLG